MDTGKRAVINHIGDTFVAVLGDCSPMKVENEVKIFMQRNFPGLYVARKAPRKKTKRGEC